MPQDNTALEDNDVTPENLKAILRKFSLEKHYDVLAPLLKPTLVWRSEGLCPAKERLFCVSVDGQIQKMHRKSLNL